MNPAEIDAIVAGAQAARSGGAAGTTGTAPAPATPDFAELGESMLTGGEVPLSMLLDLTLPVTIELGRTSMTVQELLRLGRGSVITLDRLAGEPIEIFVGERRFAEGEVVVLGEHFGVRVTRILSRLPTEAAA